MASPQLAPAPPTAFKSFFDWCKLYLKQRGWGRLDEAAARYLKNFGLILRDPSETPGGAIERLLDAVPSPRITKARLIAAAAQEDDGETEWVLPDGVGLSGRPTYQMRAILDHRRINGRVVFLTTWEPTWEPAANRPSGEIKKYRKRKQCERKYIEAEAQED